MSRSIRPEQLGDALGKELTIYSETVTKRINTLSEDAAKTLVAKTKETAPRRTGNYKRAIACKRNTQTKRGDKWVWYVKAPYYRLTHLLVHGHATQKGGRTKSYPFLSNAVDDVIPAYEEAVKEVLKG